MSFGACRLLLPVLVKLSVRVGRSKPFVHGTCGRGEREQREVEDASVEIVEFLAGLVERDNCGFQLGFRFASWSAASMPWRLALRSFQAR